MTIRVLQQALGALRFAPRGSLPHSTKRAPGPRACGSEEETFFFAYPALIPQCASAPRKRTGLLSAVPGGTWEFISPSWIGEGQEGEIAMEQFVSATPSFPEEPKYFRTVMLSAARAEPCDARASRSIPKVFPSTILMRDVFTSFTRFS